MRSIQSIWVPQICILNLRNFYRIRFRIDGELRKIAQPPLAIKEKLASRIKVISKLDISEKRVPQDGRMKIQLTE